MSRPGTFIEATRDSVSSMNAKRLWFALIASAMRGPFGERVHGNPSMIPVSASPDVAVIAIVPSSLITRGRFVSFFFVQLKGVNPSRSERFASPHP